MSQNILLNILIEAGVPVYIEGPRGDGKSSVLRGLGRALDRHTEVIISSIRSPEDFGGLPMITDQGVALVAPGWAHRLAKAPRGLLVLDEITHARPPVQCALMCVVNDKQVGEQYLGDHTSIVAAGNGASTMGNSPMMDALKNRFAHLAWDLELQTWFDGALTGFADPVAQRLPDGWEQGVGAQMAVIVSFLRKNPELAKTKDEDAEHMMAFPTKRTWTILSRVLAAAASIGYGTSSAISAQLAQMLVGEAAARTYTVWVQQQDLVDPEELLAAPATHALPVRGDRIAIMLDALCAATLTRGTYTPAQVIARYAAAWVVIDRVLDAGHKDMAFPAQQLLASNKPAGAPFPGASVGKMAPMLAKAGLLATR